MSIEDWEQFAEQGDRWNPGTKRRRVILDPGDFLIMGDGVIHSVLTLGGIEPCLMVRGMFWDKQDILHLLDKLYWIVKNQNITNEPVAYQLA